MAERQVLRTSVSNAKCTCEPYPLAGLVGAVMMVERLTVALPMELACLSLGDWEACRSMLACNSAKSA